MSLTVDELIVGQLYTRVELAKLWGYESHAAIAKGVVTAKGSKTIVLFVTGSKQAALTQYDDFIDGPLLFWEGEKMHRSDHRILKARSEGESIHLMFRERHHSPFTYLGTVLMEDADLHDDQPSEFIFRIPVLEAGSPIPEPELAAELKDLPTTRRLAIIQSRVGQGIFRARLIHRWKGRCAVTGCPFWPSLRASHIKPWAIASNAERLNPANGLLLTPNLDALFDMGVITFDPRGSLIVSKHVSEEEVLGLLPVNGRALIDVPSDSLVYLEYHRKEVFEHRDVGGSIPERLDVG